MNSLVCFEQEHLYSKYCTTKVPTMIKFWTEVWRDFKRYLVCKGQMKTHKKQQSISKLHTCNCFCWLLENTYLVSLVESQSLTISYVARNGTVATPWISMDRISGSNFKKEIEKTGEMQEIHQRTLVGQLISSWG